MITTSRTWVVALLADPASEVPVAQIESDFLRRIPDSRVYFPARSIKGTLAWDHAFGAYAFVEVPPNAHVHKLERSKFVDCVMRSPDGERFEELRPDQMVEVFKAAKPRTLRRGTRVKITGGEWEGMQGAVQEVSRADYKVAVQIRLHSRRVVVRASLHEVERA